MKSSMLRLRKPLAAEQGQALVFTILFAAATGVVCLLLFNSGMLANTKTQLQNAADAGAYSGAVMLARDHNFTAYTNRAMVANQVAVAQLVSLKSYMEDAADTHDRLTGIILSVESLVAPSKPAWKAAKKLPIQSLNKAYQKVAPPAVKALDKLIAAFDVAQNLHHHATGLNTMVTADEVVKKNDPKASVTASVFPLAGFAMQIKKWEFDYTKQFRANDNSKEADRFADVVVHKDTTDSFMLNRTSVPLPFWAETPTAAACFFVGFPQFTGFAFNHMGGTILSSNKQRWLALDATMGGGGVSCMTPTIWGPVYWGYPLVDGFGGSGGAVAGKGGGYGEVNGYKNNSWLSSGYGWALWDPITMIPGWIKYGSGPGSTLDSSGGLQKNYRDMAAPLTTKIKDQSPELNGGDVPLTFEVEHKGADVRTSDKFLGGASNIKLDNKLKGNTMKSLASAHAYFYRANKDSNAFTKSGWKRGDNKTEIANLFNPYWQARLIEPDLLKEKTPSRIAQ